MNEWKPIAEYDAKKKKPRPCVFYVEAHIDEGRANNSLPALISTERSFGRRNITHYFELPAPPKG